MNEKEKPEGEKRPSTSGLVFSPRAYFGRASRAATRALRHGITEASEAEAAATRPPPLVHRRGDPALRLFAALTLPFSPTVPLTGAVATLSGVRDGAHEKLLIELGTSLVRSASRRDENAGTFSLILSRTQSAETYRGLLASLRYVNGAPAPTAGVRRVVLQTVDATGGTQDVAAAALGVGVAPPRAETVLPAVGEHVILGETLRFNGDGDYTLFWWPRLLPGAGERTRRARPSETEADAGGSAGSFFSAGGRFYRLHDARRARAPEPFAANDSGASGRDPRRGRDAVWTPGRGVPPPGFARTRVLRLEDIFGSDMQDAVARRLIEQRVAAGG